MDLKTETSVSEKDNLETVKSRSRKERRVLKSMPNKLKRPKFDFISLVGEILIIFGLLGCLFAFWDVFVTDWQVADFNTVAVKQLDKKLPSCPNRVSNDIRTDNPPISVLSDPGEPMAALHIPKWNYMLLPVREGVGSIVLDTGAAGHYPSTAMPGQIGNFSVAAHRRSYGSNFRRIDTLTNGDVVIVETPEAWLIYKMIAKEIVTPDTGQVIAPVPDKPGEKPTERLMTMTTCHPEYGDWQRYIVHLKLDHWVPRSSGIPQELEAGGKACSR